MLIKDRVKNALNEQIIWELYSSYLYLSMSAYFSSINLAGFAHWMRIQAQEELLHAMKFYDFIIARGGRVVLEEIDKPEVDWESPQKVVEDVYNHEVKVTGLIHNLMDLATSEKDYSTMSMLQWFIDEQVEEEATADDILQRLRMVSGDRGTGVLYMLDKELAMRPVKLQVVVSGEK